MAKFAFMPQNKTEPQKNTASTLIGRLNMNKCSLQRNVSKDRSTPGMRRLHFPTPAAHVDWVAMLGRCSSLGSIEICKWGSNKSSANSRIYSKHSNPRKAHTIITNILTDKISEAQRSSLTVSRSLGKKSKHPNPGIVTAEPTQQTTRKYCFSQPTRKCISTVT